MEFKREEEKKYFVAVHIGAGYHSSKKTKDYHAILEKACLLERLKEGLDALNAVVETISFLEDSPHTNAGYGSNLNEKGEVECDASVFCGSSHGFGAVGAVSGVKNPTQLAAKILTQEKLGTLPGGRIRPIFLVGEGAREWAKEHKVTLVDPRELITEETRRQFEEQKKKVQQAEDEEAQMLYDTVGAICVDAQGNVAAGVSSGGIALKHRGRVGEAAHYGSGCWADNGSDSKFGTACSTSGVGEQIMKSMLSYECAKLLQKSDSTEEAIKQLFEENFLSDMNSNEKRYAGLIALVKHPGFEDLEFVYAHTTPSFGVAYFNNKQSSPQVLISRLKPELAGRSVKFSGAHIRLAMQKLSN